MDSGGKEKRPEEAIANITKGPDKKEDLMIIMNAHSNWDRFFIPAPISISLLGELLLLSADKNISLRERCPEGAFTHLKYPDSLTACLVQISDSGWDAFNEAHTNMDQIRLYTSNVETHIKSAVKILFGGSVREVEKLLPLSLSKVAEIADTCKELASSTEQKFINVMQLTGEMLEVCTAAKGHYENERRDIENAIQVAKGQKQQSEEFQKLLEERCHKMEREMRQAKEDFDAAINEMPYSFTMMGAFLVEGFVETMQDASSSISAFKATSRAHVISSEHKNDLPVADEITVGTVNKVKCYINTIQTLFKDNKPNMNEIAEGKADVLMQTLQKEKERMDNQTSKIRDDVLQCIDVAIMVCTELIAYTNRGQHDDDKAKNITENYASLKQKLFSLEAKLKKCSYPIQPSRPRRESQGVPETLIGAVTESARFKIEMAKQIYEDARQKHDEAYEGMIKECERQRETLVELQSLDLSTIEFEQIQSILCKGIRALAEVREQWGKLCQFFQMISNIIKCCLQSTLQIFVEYSREGRDLLLEGEKMSSIFKDAIIEQAMEANRVAFVVQSISTAYVEISRNYLMDGIASLGKLAALNSKENVEEMNRKRSELHSMMERAQKSITNIMETNKREFDAKIEKRLNRIKTEVEAILLPIPEARIKEIKTSVQEAYDEKQAAIDHAVDDLF